MIVFYDIGQAYLKADGLSIPRSVVSALQYPEQATYSALRHYAVRFRVKQELCVLDSSESSMSDSEGEGSDSEGCGGGRGALMEGKGSPLL